MRVHGSATTGGVYNSRTPDLPRADGRLAAHRPWCRDCKVKHDATELDADGRCARCARAAAARAEAEARRTPDGDQVWEQALAEYRGTGRRATPAKKTARTTPNERVPGTRQPAQHRAPRPAAVRRVNHTARITRLEQRRDKLRAQVADVEQQLEQLVAEHNTERPAAGQPERRAPDAPRATRSDKLQLPDQDVIDAYLAGDGTAELALRYQCSIPTIRRVLLEHQVPIRGKRTDYTPELIESVRAAYVDQELSTAEAAELLGVGTKVVVAALGLAGVALRPAVARNPRNAARHVKDRLIALGVPARTVKVWALEQGLVTELKRGIPSAALVDAYATAHAPQGAP